jgi:hypothetical protein
MSLLVILSSSWSASTASTCNVYVPKLQRELGVVGFIREHLGKPVASTAVLADRTEKFYAEVRRFAAASGVEIVEFAAQAAQGLCHARAVGGVPGRRGHGGGGVHRPGAGEGEGVRRHPAP